jgi:membrane fusion protein (multidrug efflux system)
MAQDDNVKRFEPHHAQEPRREEPPAAPAAEAPAPKPEKGDGSPVKRILTWAILVAFLTGGAIFGLKEYRFYSAHVETDDAQVEAHLSPVLARVAGYVAEIRVNDNDAVKTGDALLTIDPGDLSAKVQTAAASLENAKAAVAVARANAQAATTARGKAEGDWTRYQALRAKEEISKQQADAAKAAADASVAQEEAARRQIAAAEAHVAQKKADLDLAQLQLSYTKVVSPATGTVSKKNVEVGQFVQPGQPLMAIVSEAEPWIVANFKETQLKKMRVGQPVDVEVDAYPGVVFHGTVQSISAATGAKFALLPPDNATGNFTKVVQRVPVKIVLSGPRDAQRPLRAGMSVNAIVDVR